MFPGEQTWFIQVSGRRLFGRGPDVVRFLGVSKDRIHFM